MPRENIVKWTNAHALQGQDDDVPLQKGLQAGRAKVHGVPQVGHVDGPDAALCCYGLIFALRINCYAYKYIKHI